MNIQRSLFSLLAVSLALLLALGSCVLFDPPPPPETEPDWGNLPVHDPEPASVSRYYFEQLSQIEKHAYTMVLEELESFPEEIEVPPINRDQLEQVFLALTYDNPRLMMLGNRCEVNPTGGKSYFSCEYRYDEELYRQKAAALDEAVAEILREMPLALSEWETELYLHDALLTRCSFTHSGNPDEGTAYGALVTGEARCEGYARAMKLLMDEVGLQCYVICGSGVSPEGKPENHMWNIVRIENDYYHLDPTWNDPVSDRGETHRYLYFNLSDEEISKTHSEFYSVHSCHATQANYFVKTGLLFQEYNDRTRTKISSALAERVNAGYSNLEFRFAEPAAYQQALDGLKDGQVGRILTNAALSSRKKFETQGASYMANDDFLVINLIVTLK